MEQCSFLFPSAFSDVSCSVVIFPVSLVDVHCISNTTASTAQVDKPQTERSA